MSDEIELKLSRARTRLIIDKPFLGALVLRLPLKQADPEWCPTTATDARSFYYNSDYIDALSPGQTQFVLAHEALHCALSHFARREHRDKFRWDVACDYAVNPLLVHDGLEEPPGTLLESSYADMTAEEIYRYIDENTTDQPMDKHLYDQEQSQGKGENREQPPPESRDDDRDGSSDGEGDGEGEGDRRQQPDQDGGGASQPPPLTAQEQEELAVQWQQRMAGAAQQAMQAGKMGGAMGRMIDHLLQPQLPWRMLLARYMTSTGRDDYSYHRPSNRREGPAIYPSLHSTQMELVVAVDSSGSVSDKEMAEFAAEVNAIKGQVRARVTLLVCDAQLAPDAPWRFEAWEEFTLPAAFGGGGGTSFRPVFGWAVAQDMAPDLLVYFTDAQGEFPEREPAFPVLWLIKGKAPVPWGRRIQLN